MAARVMVGCPVRNRAWVLPSYLENLLRMDFAISQMEFCFIINDSSDDTQGILESLARSLPGQVRLLVKSHPRPGGYQRGYYSLSRLAELRNDLLQVFLNSTCTHLFSVDSDILVPPHALTRLLEDRCDIVSALVCNGHEIGDAGIFNILNQDSWGRYQHLRNFPDNEIFAVDCTGAAYLIARTVIEDHHVRYSANGGAEDIGFCENARRRQLGIFCDSRVKCRHLMREAI